MAHVVAAAGFFAEPQVPINLAPFALGADALVAMLTAVFPLVDISSAKEGVVFAVGGQDHPFAGGGFQ